jgi:hypothetical protein
LPLALQCGDTFLLPRKSSATEHLWIIITDPDPKTSEAVCVNITSRRSDSETTVIITAGEHPFVTRESVTYYKDARIIALSAVEQMLRFGSKGQFACAQHQPCGKALLTRIQQGVLASDSPSKDLQNYCKKACGVKT